MSSPRKARNLVLVFGDQLNDDSTAFDGFDDARDAVAMHEVREEASYVPQHKQRIALFFAAMRHFRDRQREAGRTVHYRELTDRDNRGNFADEIAERIRSLRPERLIAVEPGDWRVREILKETAHRHGVELDLREDEHFLCSREQFESFAKGRKNLLLEFFYRAERKRLDLMMNGKEPRGGAWNFDKDNRESFGADGPGKIRPLRSFPPDPLTREVLGMVAREFPDSPGKLEGFDYPVTPGDANKALTDFIEHRLGNFGSYQDAMVTGEPFLYHSRLSSSLNLHLLDPREAVTAAIKALDEDRAPINAVEGFVRQIVGWREYVRGIYWLKMPGYADMNALNAQLEVPEFMWTAETEMRCMGDSVGQLVEHAYAHHIQRLMVLGLYTMMLGVRPFAVHEWHMSMYADAIDWVSMPNVVGMSQFGDGGIVGTKPYCATGKYIDRMSDYCKDCRYDPKKSSGDDACPFTTLYWDFLARNRPKLSKVPRMNMQLRNLDRKSKGELLSIRSQAEGIRDQP